MQHLQTTAVHYSRHWCQFNSGRSVVSTSPVVSEDTLIRLTVFSLRLFRSAHFCTSVSSACHVISLLAGMMMYVSSAYLHIEFPGAAAMRSPAVTTYAAGPMADSWTKSKSVCVWQSYIHRPKVLTYRTQSIVSLLFFSYVNLLAYIQLFVWRHMKGYQMIFSYGLKDVLTPLRWKDWGRYFEFCGQQRKQMSRSSTKLE